MVLGELAAIAVVAPALLLLPLHRCRHRLVVVVVVVVVEEEEEEEEEEDLLPVRLGLLQVKEALQALLGRRGWEGRRRRFCIKVCEEGKGRREGGRGGEGKERGVSGGGGREGERDKLLCSPH